MKTPSIEEFKVVNFDIELLSSRELTDGEKIVMVLISKLCDITFEYTGDYYTKMPNRYLERILGKPHRSIHNALQRLVERDYLFIHYGVNRKGVFKTDRTIYMTPKGVKIAFGITTNHKPYEELL